MSPTNDLISILAIESSCDETACAIVQKSPDTSLVKVTSSITATSLAKHKATQGIVPEVAAREQLKYILPVIEDAIKEHKTLKLDAIAVTTGPGLVGSLLVGIETARALAVAWQLPVIPVNHVQAHPYANFVKQQADEQQEPDFPILSWVISGGHTDLYLMNSHQDIQKLGSTVDDAAGECFDKCARVLGFDYPGGPFIEKLAQECNNDFLTAFKGESVHLPRPLLHEKTFDMSFSGLKTAFLRAYTEKNKTVDAKDLKVLLAHELQEAIGDIMIKRTEQALKEFPTIRSIIVSGGVAANKRLKQKLEEKLLNTESYQHISLHFPPLSLCTDNAVMIGAYAAFHFDQKTSWDNVRLMLR
ncbi:MAG: tRNA (adenosine(37)-N6)-threonylcarbamoyltransferase complex transferase subunit TsaD [Patescibacteria group bacterium]